MALLSICSSTTFDSLASVESLKALLSVTSSANDGVMSDILKQATETVESYLGRPLRKATYFEKVASYGSMFLQVTNTPVQTISRILKDDFLVGSTEYELAGAGTIYRRFGWAWTAGVVTDLVPHAMPGTERFSFSIEYVGGYVPSTSTSTEIGVPGPLEKAVLEIGKSWWLGRKLNPTVSAKQVGDLRITYGSGGPDAKGGVSGLPPAVISLLNNYQRVV